VRTSREQIGVMSFGDPIPIKMLRRLVWGYFRGLCRVLDMFCPLFSFRSNQLVFYCMQLYAVVLDCSLLGSGCAVENYCIRLE
jgi:hypothetical protein